MKFVVADRREGGMGIVFRLTPVDLQRRDFALKALSSRGNWEMAEREARMWISLGSHDGLAHAVWAGLWQERPAILAHWYPRTVGSVDPCTWNGESFVRFIAKVLAALNYAHERCGLIHRDIKPSNILLDEEGGPRLADFGVAWLAPQSPVSLNSSDAITKSLMTCVTTESFQGTPFYMAPELFLKVPPSVKTDLFSLGVTLYQILTAEHPFLGRETNGRWRPIFRLEPLRQVIAARMSDYPEILPLIQKCLSLDPDERPASYGNALDLLQGARGSPEKRGPPADSAVKPSKASHPDATTIVALAKTIENQGDCERATDTLLQALRSSPDDPLLLNAAGCALTRGRTPEIAAQYFKRASERIVRDGGYYAGRIYADPVMNFARYCIRSEAFADAAGLVGTVRRWCESGREPELNRYPELGWLLLYERNEGAARKHFAGYARYTNLDLQTIRWYVLAAILTGSASQIAGEITNDVARLWMEFRRIPIPEFLIACLVSKHLDPVARQRLLDEPAKQDEDLLPMLRARGLNLQDLKDPFSGPLLATLGRLLDGLEVGGRNYGII